MSVNTFGTNFRVTTFGESHGKAIGCVIDGCPQGIYITKEIIQQALNKRKVDFYKFDDKTKNKCTSNRNEPDSVEIISGIYNNKTQGSPITLLIQNQEQNPNEYNELQNTFRPGHADYTYDIKYQGMNDKRGGGRASGRETACRVAAGAIANQILKEKNIKITAYTIRAAGINVQKKDLSQIEQNPLRAPDNDAAAKMYNEVCNNLNQGDSSGGIIECLIENCPPGLGNPIFNKLDATLSFAMLSIGSVKGIEFGDGFLVADSVGSKNNDQMTLKNNNPHFLTNHSGGILGGISTGQDIIFRLAIKPVPSINKEQQTIKKNLDGSYSETTLQVKGRHDSCLCPRIVPVVEAMASIVIADFIL